MVSFAPVISHPVGHTVFISAKDEEVSGLGFIPRVVPSILKYG